MKNSSLVRVLLESQNEQLFSYFQYAVQRVGRPLPPLNWKEAVNIFDVRRVFRTQSYISD